MATTKKKVLRPPQKRRPLSQRIETPVADPNGEKEEKSVGPLGNADYVAFGSPEHLALLGFDENGETMFDTVGAEPRHLERFLSQRKRWAESGEPPLPAGVPTMWDPDGEPNVTEVV